MSERTIGIGRKYSVWRISAYECEAGSSGVSYKLGKTGKPIYVRGWDRLFDEHRLKNEIMPKLAEYAKVGKHSYPFLITQHRLQKETTAHVTPPRDVKFDPRKPATGHTWCAVVLSDTEFELLSPSTS